MKMVYRPLNIDYKKWIELEGDDRMHMAGNHLKENRKYIEHHLGKSFWIIIGANSGRTLARGDREDIPVSVTERINEISRKYEEPAILYTEPVGNKKK